MRIKSLEVAGFKSFAQRAKLQFGKGITGVVGPNGCGKSNVVDAIRWVMGEMSAKHLRGRAMQDVIFAGAEGRGAQSMAEVTLTFDNDGDVPPQYLSASEIAVTRRLFRDGTSEYAINKSTVRLRDITDLFLGTGVGTRAYSIIEQGRIGFVVNARPEERRTLIEEVAGITKFKVRKKAAERRMESTEQNLARVRDVLQELDRQLVSLRHQAERARTYRELKTQLYDLELHRASYEWLRLRLVTDGQSRAHEALKTRLHDGGNTLAEEEAAYDSAQAALSTDEQQLAALQAEASQTAATLAAEERDIVGWRAQAAQLREQVARAAEEAHATAERLAAAEEEGQRLAAAHEGAADDAAKAAQGLEELGEQVSQLQAELNETDAELNRLRQEALAKVQAAAESQSRIASLAAQLESITEQMARSQPEQDRAREEEGGAQAAVATAKSEQERLEAESQRLDADIQQAATTLEEAEVARRERAQTLREQESELAKTQHRLSSLEEIVRRMDGYADGVRWLVGKDKKGQPRFAQASALKGVVAEVLDVPSAHERAIEAVLGDRLQYLRVDKSETARDAIAALKEGKAGQSGFVAGEPTPAAALPKQVGTKGKGVYGLARELVDAHEGADHLVDALLGAVVLVDTLETAEREAHAHAGIACTWVTAEGEMVDGHGLWRGGTPSGAGLLATRREIRELQSLHKKLDAKVQACTVALETATQAMSAARTAHADTKDRRQQNEVARVSCRRDVEACTRDLQRATKRLAELVEAARALEERRSACAQAHDAAVAEARSVEGQGDDARAQIEAGEQRRHEQAEAHRALAEQWTEGRVREAGQRERAEALATASKRLADDVARMQEQQQRSQAAVGDGTRDAESLEERANAAHVSLEERQLALRTTEASLAEQRAGVETRRQDAIETEQRLRVLRRDAGEAHTQLSEQKLALQKLELERDGLIAQVRERHDVELEEVLPDFHDRPAPSAQAKREQGRLWREIKDMGSINLTAIEECEQVDTRARFLRAQQDDLEEALTTLRQAVSRINKDSRERFREAFDAVNQMFEKVYPRLFGGGSARLHLTESEDILEAGVEIVAMPPGKKLQNVTLLSGGEKALTATALVFSIFLIKPSPFCILDEVDAPLDEANVGRFNEMLREISKISQFIVITHNKQTMLQTDRLFGVTMEQAGMSKVVAVDLEHRQGVHAA